MRLFGGNTCTLAELPSKEDRGGGWCRPIRCWHAGCRQACCGLRQYSDDHSAGDGVESGCMQKSTLSLPTCTWAEKSGVYENFEGAFSRSRRRSLPLGETPRSTGQIFLGFAGNAGQYNASKSPRVAGRRGATPRTRRLLNRWRRCRWKRCSSRSCKDLAIMVAASSHRSMLPSQS